MYLCICCYLLLDSDFVVSFGVCVCVLACVSRSPPDSDTLSFLKWLWFLNETSFTYWNWLGLLCIRVGLSVHLCTRVCVCLCLSVCILCVVFGYLSCRCTFRMKQTTVWKSEFLESDALTNCSALITDAASTRMSLDIDSASELKSLRYSSYGVMWLVGGLY